MKTIRDRLSAKLFVANLLVIFIGVVILAITMQVTIPTTFNRHMAGMMDQPMAGGMG